MLESLIGVNSKVLEGSITQQSGISQEKSLHVMKLGV